jgi:hypothetical protein
MPFFDQNPLERLIFQPGDADVVLDLQGLPPDTALRRVESLLRDAPRSKSYLIRFDPAVPDGRETLFLPLGRRLLQARREGRLNRCLPASDGAGYFIAFAD